MFRMEFPQLNDMILEYENQLNQLAEQGEKLQLTVRTLEPTWEGESKEQFIKNAEQVFFPLCPVCQ